MLHVESWKSAWLGLISTLAMRKGRWQLCGEIRGFRREDWPIPPARESIVDESEPVSEWGKHPWGEMWSIATTTDEPTLTLIDNAPATREQALQFPRVDFTTAASRLEKALVTHFKGRQRSFWDMELSLESVPAGAIKRWREYAEAIRAGSSPEPLGWLPPGRKTDRALRAGMWLGMPLQGGGFGAAMLVAKQEPHERFFSDAVVMGMRRKWERWPTLAELATLTPDDGALVAPTTMAVVRDGRWRVIGEHPNFDAEQWPWPIPWSSERGNTDKVQVSVPPGKYIEIHIDPEILSLDSNTGRRCAGMSSPGAIEMNIPRVMAGTLPKGLCDDAVVTSGRLQAWRQINRAIRDAIREQCETD
jgi:hypothetical protein